MTATMHKTAFQEWLRSQCARQALRFVPKGELRPLRAIETAEAWADGHATINAVRAAANAAAAAYAANAADYAYDAAYAANAADYAYAASNQTREQELKEMCAIVRDMFPFPGC